MIFRIGIWPKEAPPGVEKAPLKKIEGGLAPWAQKVYRSLNVLLSLDIGTKAFGSWNEGKRMY